MEIAHAAQMEWGANLAAHRNDAMAHKVLFEGEEGSPDNFALVLAKEGADYYSPRHRHAWDQVRYCLDGSVPLGPGLTVDAGEVAYFPEGVVYGPQEKAAARVELLLQFGGASGHGYLSAAQVRRAREDLSAEGKFEDGAFKRRSGAGKKNADAYEAIWQHVTGKPLAYPEPRYKTPIVMRASSFPWVACDEGVKKRMVAFFPDRCVALEFVAITPEAKWMADAGDSRLLAFARHGEGCFDGEPFMAETALRLEPGETTTISATADTELFLVSVAPVAAL
jgi:hypothetical protein